MTKPPRKKPEKAGARKVSAGWRRSVTARHQFADATSTVSLVLPEDAEVTALALDLGKMIEAARRQVAQTVNVGLTLLHWRIGQRIRSEILGKARAAYGAAIVSTLSRQLVPRFGRGYSEKGLRHMVRFAEAFTDGEIVSTLSRELASEAACTGKPYQTRLDPPPADPRVAHPGTRLAAEKKGQR